MRNVLDLRKQTGNDGRLPAVHFAKLMSKEEEDKKKEETVLLSFFYSCCPLVHPLSSCIYAFIYLPKGSVAASRSSTHCVPIMLIEQERSAGGMQGGGANQGARPGQAGSSKFIVPARAWRPQIGPRIALIKILLAAQLKSM